MSNRQGYPHHVSSSPSGALDSPSADVRIRIGGAVATFPNDDATGKNRHQRGVLFGIRRSWRLLPTMQRVAIVLITMAFAFLMVMPASWTHAHATYSFSAGVGHLDDEFAASARNTTHALLDLLSKRAHEIAVLSRELDQLRAENKRLQRQGGMDEAEMRRRMRVTVDAEQELSRALEESRVVKEQMMENRRGEHEEEGGREASHDEQEALLKEEEAKKKMMKKKRVRGPNIPLASSHNERQRAVVDAYRWAWKGYKEYAWGKDELLPISQTSSTWFDLALTMVDGLDTMLIMGLRDEFDEAAAWMKQSWSLDSPKDVNLFETTIRILGGLLATHHLSHDTFFLDKARDLGDRLMCAFETNSGVPLSDVNLRTRKAHGPAWGSDSSTSEVTTIQLEFNYLSRVTGDPKYAAAANRVMDVVFRQPTTDGLVPIWISPDKGTFRGSTITMGARGDSYYEYLFKGWLLSHKTDVRLKDQYEKAVKGIRKHLVKTTPHGLVIVGELISGSFSPKMDHLACFLPGVLAMGAHHGLASADLTLGKQVLDTCIRTYTSTPTGLAPEITHFNMGGGQGGNDMIMKAQDSHNLLRPETLESIYYMYQLTKNETYRDIGWRIFQSFEKHCRVSSGGYTSLKSVLQVPPPTRDKMESFFLGETLKYLFLLFSDDSVMSLDQYVWNTEAHALPIYDDDDQTQDDTGAPLI